MLISVVVPSYQQAKFLSRTLESLVSQQGVNLEIIIQDGGSADGSVEIIRAYAEKYPQTIRWQSGKDNGQTYAINIGLQKAKGDILCYLNSDDIFYLDALKKVANYFLQNPDAMILYGQADHIDEDNQIIGAYPTEPWNYERLLETCFICQPACFWKKEIVEKYGLFDASLQYSMDYEYWLRVGEEEKFHYFPEKLAASRCHLQAKRFDAELAVREEAMRVVCRHNRGKAPLSWIAGVARCRAARCFKEDLCPLCSTISFCLSYWINFILLLPKLSRFKVRQFFKKFIPPIKSEFQKQEDVFYHLRNL